MSGGIDGHRPVQVGGVSGPVQAVSSQSGATAAVGPAFELAERFKAAPEFARIQGGAATLDVGARGEGVKVLQRALQELGMLPADAKIDGVFQRNTQNALSAFQRQSGVTTSGSLDRATLAKLSETTAPLDLAAAIESALAKKKGGDATDKLETLAAALCEHGAGQTWATDSPDPQALRTFQAVMAKLEKDGKLVELQKAVGAEDKKQFEAGGRMLPYHSPAREVSTAVEKFATPSQIAAWQGKPPGGDDAAGVAKLFQQGKKQEAFDRGMQAADPLIENMMGGRWMTTRLADADAGAVGRFRDFLATLGPKLTDLAKAAAAAPRPTVGEDNVPVRIESDQLAALVGTFGTDAQKRLWNAGAPKLPAVPQQI